MLDWRGKPSPGLLLWSGNLWVGGGLGMAGGAEWSWGWLVAGPGSPGNPGKGEPLAETELPRIKYLEFLLEAPCMLCI